MIFSGPHWSDEVRDGVMRELRIELARRSLSVCAGPPESSEAAPDKVVTLLAADTERVAIVASNLEKEGGFTGRTIIVGSIPEDARALAIAQAVDEALRTGGNEPPATPKPRAAAPVSRTPPRAARSPSWFIAAAVAPTLQIAPASSGRTHALAAPGVALRLSLGRASVGGSLGVAITRASDLSFGSVEVRDFRLPADASFDVRFARGPAQVTLDVGLVAALVNYSYGPTGDAHSAVELGGRAGLRFGWGHRFVPWIGTSIEAMPRAIDFRFAPTGSFGQAPSVWLGFALGTEVKWP